MHGDRVCIQQTHVSTRRDDLLLTVHRLLSALLPPFLTMRSDVVQLSSFATLCDALGRHVATWERLITVAWMMDDG